MDTVRKAHIVITNYHAFMPKEKEQVSKPNRQILGGREGEKRFTETVGEMIERVGGTALLGDHIRSAQGRRRSKPQVGHFRCRRLAPAPEVSRRGWQS